MRGGPAVGVDDDLAPGQAAVAVRPADDEVAGRIDVPLGLFGDEARRQHLADVGLDDQPHVLRRQPLLVLGRQHDRGGPHRFAALIGQGHLALGVRLQPGLLARMAGVGQHLQDVVRVLQRRRHQLGRLVRRIAEHDALVARALVLVARGVHPHGDVGRLAVQVAGEVGVLPVEALLLVADVLHRRADLLLQALDHPGRAAHLAGDHDPVGGHQGLAGHPRIRVRRQERIHHHIRYPVRHLVRVTLRNALAREQVGGTRHAWPPQIDAAGRSRRRDGRHV